MYTPSAFKVEEIEQLQAFMKEFSFATLVSAVDGCPVATHLPFVVRPSDGQLGTLVAHMARANPLWSSWTPDTEVLVIFTGPHAYVSPSWYEHKVAVPTWNYSAVHAYGKPKLISDLDALSSLVVGQTEHYERQENSRWDRALMGDLLPPLLKAIVGFTIEIERIEGKFKFNQNRSSRDQDGVAHALHRSGCPFKRSVASFMRTLARGQ